MALDKVVINEEGMIRSLNKINAFYANARAMDTAAENELNRLRIDNAKKLKNLKLSLINEEKKAYLQVDFDVRAQMLKEGKLATDEEVAYRIEAKKKELEANATLDAAARAKELKNYKNQLKAQRILDEKEATDRIKAEEKRRKEKEKRDKLNAAKEAGGAAYNKWGTGFAGIMTAASRQKAEEEYRQAYRDSHNGAEASAEELAAFNKGMTQKRLDEAAQAISNFAWKIRSDVEELGGMKTLVDTRLQGSKNLNLLGSYWELMNMNTTRVVGLSPLIKQSAVNENIKTLVNQGIAFDVQQRAFLQTISEKIANTFEATDKTLLRLVRIQQQDSTAARLGMESALTSFLNRMYETSEYMQGIASDVRSSLEEAEALMGTKSAAAFEYQVQKWLGSLYSVGMSQQSVSGIATILGQIASGNISGLNGQGAGNLVIMAANRAGMSIADILNGGLSDNETNVLMNAMVTYLAGIYEETKNSLVVQQQYANVFGVTASDLKAAASLSSSLKAVRNQNLNYTGMQAQLYAMAATMYSRTSMGEMMNNMFANLNYSIAAGIANNPVMYALYTLAGMLKDTTGGIALPFVNVFGSGFDLNTTVADLMAVGAMAGGLLSSLGPLMAGLATGGGFSGMGMLAGMGILPGVTNTVVRGSGFGLLSTSGYTTSDSGYVGNGSGDDVKNKTLTDANDEGSQQVENGQDSSDQVQIKDVNDNVVSILQLLEQVVNGSARLSVTLGDETVWTTPRNL